MKENKITQLFKRSENRQTHLEPWQKTVIGVSVLVAASLAVGAIFAPDFMSDYEKDYKSMKKGLKKCAYYESMYDALCDNDVNLNAYTAKFVQDTTINRALLAIDCIDNDIEVEKNGQLLVGYADSIEESLINNLKCYIQEELATDENITINTKVEEISSDSEDYETYIIVGEGNSANYFKPDRNIEDAIDAIISLQKCKRYNSSGELTYVNTTKYEEFSKIMKEAILKNAAITNTNFETNEKNTKIKSLS